DLSLEIGDIERRFFDRLLQSKKRQSKNDNEKERIKAFHKLYRGAVSVRPTLCFCTVVAALHGDGAGGGANEGAEIAADAFGFDDAGVAVAVGFDKLDALVGAIFAGDIAEVAANAVVFVYMDDDLVAQ